MDRVSNDNRYTETETDTETEIETIRIRKTERETLEARLGKRGWAIRVSERTAVADPEETGYPATFFCTCLLGAVGLFGGLNRLSTGWSASIKLL